MKTILAFTIGLTLVLTAAFIGDNAGGYSDILAAAALVTGVGFCVWSIRSARDRLEMLAIVTTCVVGILTVSGCQFTDEQAIEAAAAIDWADKRVAEIQLERDVIVAEVRAELEVVKEDRAKIKAKIGELEATVAASPDPLDPLFATVNVDLDRLREERAKANAKMDELEWKLDVVDSRFNKRFDEVAELVRTVSAKVQGAENFEQLVGGAGQAVAPLLPPPWNLVGLIVTSLIGAAGVARAKQQHNKAIEIEQAAERVIDSIEGLKDAGKLDTKDVDTKVMLDARQGKEGRSLVTRAKVGESGVSTVLGF